MTHENNAADTTEEQPDNRLRTDGGAEKGSAGQRPLAQIKMNRRRVDTDEVKPTAKEILAETGRTPPEEFDVFRLENESDTEGTKIPLTEVINRLNEKGTVFLRAVEKDRNAG